MKRSLGMALVLGTLVAALGVPASGREAPGHVVAGRGTAAPSFVTGIHETAPAGPAARSALRYLSAHAGTYRIPSPARDLKRVRITRASGLTTVRFAQLYRGVPVFGAQYLVHFRGRASGREVLGANGHFFTRLRTSTTPRVTARAARMLAVGSVLPATGVRTVDHGLTVLPTGLGVLARHVTVWGTRLGRPLRQQVFVDARTGAVDLSYDDVESATSVPVETKNAHGEGVTIQALDRKKGITEMRDVSLPMYDPATGRGQIETHDAAGGTGGYAIDENIVSWPTGSNVKRENRRDGAVDAHWGAERVYAFYAALGRNSIDDRGMSIVSVVDLAGSGGSGLYNAFWDGHKMNYGNPDPSQVYPFSADLDVVAHELTHGVTQHSAGLVYLGQPGSMNEAFSDYFGDAVDVNNTPGLSMDDPTSGYIGEDLCRVKNPEEWHCPLRNLNDPHTTGDPATTSEYYGVLPDVDTGGVHTNMNIYSSTLWQIRRELFDAQGGQPGADRSDQIVYTALSQFDTPIDTFVDGRNALVAAAQALGATQAELDVINGAFDDHGIVDGWEASHGTDATTLVENVFPSGVLGISGPKASGDRFIYDDVVEKEGGCCRRQQPFVGTVDGSSPPVEVGGAVTSGPGNVEPDLSGDRAVWVRLAPGGGGLKSRIQTATLTGPVQDVTTSGFAVDPAVSGRRVAWTTIKGGFNTNVETRVLGGAIHRLTTSGVAMNPDTNGRWVAWADYDAATNRSAMVVQDMRTGKRTVTDSRTQYGYVGPPSLNSTAAFWFFDANNDGLGVINTMSLDTGKVRTLVGLELPGNGSFFWYGAARAPFVSANEHYVTYADESTLVAHFNGDDVPLGDAGRDVYIVPIAGGGAPVLVSNNTGDQGYPQMAGDDQQVIWLDGSQGRVDIATRPTPAG
ncbi:MAG: M4 family metallopeptidase [Actinomycetota bacterium]